MSTNLNGFEALEDRVLLAGNVTASLNTVTGAVTITGDAAANGVLILDTDGDGFYEIETDATTNLTVVVDGVVTDLGLGANSGESGVALTSIVINLGKGDDVLGLLDNNVAGDLDGNVLNVAISMGDGNDLVVVNGDTNNSGNNTINLANVSVDLGKGNDILAVLGSSANNLTVAAGAGNDGVGIEDFGSAGKLSIDGAAGNDQVVISNSFVNVIAVSLGAGNDQADINASGANSLSVSGAAGSDQVGIINSGFDNLSVSAGAGSDIVRLDNVGANRTNINMGGGKDLVEILNSGFFVSFDLKGGSQADGVQIGNSNFFGVNTLKGGGGKDVLLNLGGNTWSAATTIKSFKIV